MRKYLLALLVCWGPGLAVSSTAVADFVGINSANNTDHNCSADPAPPPPLTVCSISVQFDDNDRLLNVGNADLQVFDLTGPATFYQHGLGGAQSPKCDLFPFFPALECDTYVTIGRECQDGPGGNNNGLDPSYSISSGQMSGGWFATPFPDGTHQGDADQYLDRKVLIIQSSIATGLGMSGTLDIFYADASTGEFIAVGGVAVGCGICGECPWDTDADGDVAADSLALLLSCWGAPHTGDIVCDCLDIDDDGNIGAADLAEVLSHWGGDDNGNGIPDQCPGG